MKKTFTIICAGLLAAVTSLVADNEVWLSATPPFGDGSSASQPLDASDGKFCSTLQVQPENTLIHLAAGTYRVGKKPSGVWEADQVSPKSGWSVVGAGKDLTKIVLMTAPSYTSTPITGDPGGSAVFLAWPGAYQELSSVYFSDMTFDLSGTDSQITSFPQYPNRCSTTAISVNTRCGIVERVRVIDPRQNVISQNATGNFPREGFPFAFSTQQPNSYVRFSDCDVEIHTPGSVLTAIHAGGQGSDGFFTGEMVNNRVTYSNPSNLYNTDGMVAYGSGRIHGFLFENNISRGMNVGIIMDTYAHIDVQIIGNYFLECHGSAMAIGGNETRDRFVIRDNVITTLSRGFIFQGNTSDIVLGNNIVLNANGVSASNGIQIFSTTGAGPNSKFILYGNQFAPNLSNSIAGGAAAVVDYALGNSGDLTAIPGNISSSVKVTQPLNGPVSVDSSSLTVSALAASKLIAKSTGQTDGQLWLTSDNKSMVWAKVNNANANQLRLNYDGGSGLTGPLATFTADGFFLSGNLRYNAVAPEGNASTNCFATAGTLYANPAGGSGECLYIKETGTAGAATNTGWKKVLTESNLRTNTGSSISGQTVPGNGSADIVSSISIPSAALGDVVSIGLPSNAPSDVLYTGIVTSAGSVKIRALNPTSGSKSVPVGTYRATIIK